MTSETAEARTSPRRTPRRVKPRSPMAPQPIAIGEPDANIFNCPSCARPLATGAQRCPGCGTRLILATPARRVGIFVSAGMVIGLLFGFSFAAAMGAMSEPRTGSTATPAPTTGPGPIASVPVVIGQTPAPTVPAASRAALGQAAALNARLLDGQANLRVLLRDEDLDSAAVADTLRSLAADAAFGQDLALRLGQWDEAYELSLDLANLYGSVRSTSREALAASIRNDPAYRAAAQKMIAVLAELPPLDAKLRELAESIGVRLPAG
jgi:hypothetical protein